MSVFHSAVSNVRSPRADLERRIAFCAHEIASALEASHTDHSAGVNLGILIWELDWRAERQRLVEELNRTRDVSRMNLREFFRQQLARHRAPRCLQQEAERTQARRILEVLRGLYR